MFMRLRPHFSFLVVDTDRNVYTHAFRNAKVAKKRDKRRCVFYAKFSHAYARPPARERLVKANDCA